MNAKLQGLQTRMNELQEEMKTEFKEVFTGETKELFEKYSWLKEISWTQYTPYFNDGDACEFYVNDDCAVNGCTSYGKEPYAEAWSSILFEDDGEAAEFAETVKGNDSLATEFEEVQTKASELVGFLSSNDEIAMAMFGDHAKVSVQADGVYVEELEHD